MARHFGWPDVLSGAWVVLSAVGSFALGGYIAGRLRARWDAGADEVHFRDGVHGLLVWGLAVIIGVGMTWAAATMLTNSKMPSTAPRDTSANEPSFLTFELDRLFRSDRAPQGGDAEARAEAGRIIQTALGHTDIAADDRDYLVRRVAALTGLPPTDADPRVQQIMSESRDAAAKARRSAVILAFTLLPRWLPRPLQRGRQHWRVGVTGIRTSRPHCIFRRGDELLRITHYRAPR